jgi:hypothetical protein
VTLSFAGGEPIVFVSGQAIELPEGVYLVKEAVSAAQLEVAVPAGTTVELLVVLTVPEPTAVPTLEPTATATSTPEPAAAAEVVTGTVRIVKHICREEIQSGADLESGGGVGLDRWP